MKSKIAGLMACLALITGTAMADLMTPTRSAIDPSTPPPIGPELPLIVGTVVSVDEQSVVIDTHDANTVTFMIDSRTMMPSNMSAGMPVKTQFKLLDNGSYFAQRFTPMYGEEGRELMSRHWDLYSNQDQYAVNANDNESEDTGTSSYDRDREGASGTSRTIETEAGGEVAQVTTDNDANNNGIDDSRESGMNDNTSDDDRLPQTASTGSWIAVLGVISLAAAGGLSFARRRRSV